MRWPDRLNIGDSLGGLGSSSVYLRDTLTPKMAKVLEHEDRKCFLTRCLQVHIGRFGQVLVVHWQCHPSLGHYCICKVLGLKEKLHWQSPTFILWYNNDKFHLNHRNHCRGFSTPWSKYNSSYRRKLSSPSHYWLNLVFPNRILLHTFKIFLTC